MNKIVLAVVIALTVTGCQPTYKSKFEIITTPDSTPTAISSPKPIATSQAASRSTTVATTQYPKASTRVYVPVYQNPTRKAPSEVKSSPTVVVATITPTLSPYVAASSNNKQVSTTKLVANIRKDIGCGKVDKEYEIQVMAVAIAESNPKATEKLTEDQFYQAVRQTITENQTQANNLVAQYRTSNCSIVSKQQSKNVSVKPTVAPTVKTGAEIPEQSGNCEELSAKGITNIDVKINPWASRLDRDSDGIACEAN